MADMQQGDGDLGKTVRDVAEMVKKSADTVEHAVDKLEEEKHRWIEGTGPRPSRPLFGRLPLARIVSQDAHSISDYAAAALCASPLFVGEKLAPKLIGGLLGTTQALVSSLTDYRLSLAKVIPIEAHEVMDYVFGLSQLAAPFVFGYGKRDRASTVMHMLGGALVICLSLLTDYRAEKGIGGELPQGS